jgi:hypothetical protein
MRRYSLMLTWTLFALLPAAALADTPSVERLGWLAGVWTGTVNGMKMEEHWSTPDGGGLVGMHKDSKGGHMTSYEFFRIVPDDSGRVCYMTSPLGRTPVPFCAIELTDSRVVFENREHDFPQRILYWLEKGALHARIEGTIDGRARSEEWVWTRVKVK